MRIWLEENPMPDVKLPDRPVKNCHIGGADWDDCSEKHRKSVDEWRKRIDAIEDSLGWRKSMDKEYGRLVDENGHLLNNREGYVAFQKYFYESFDSIVAPRSEIYRCLRTSRCEDYQMADHNVMEIRMKALSEAILNNASKISELVKTTKELAVVTCNNNGFYE
jgi:hypothetical protein